MEIQCYFGPGRGSLYTETVEEASTMLEKSGLRKCSFTDGGERRILYRQSNGSDPETLIDIPDEHTAKFKENPFVFCECEFIPGIGSVTVNVFTLEELREVLRSSDEIGIKSASKVE